MGKLAPWKTDVPNILAARINVSYWREQQIEVRLTQEVLLLVGRPGQKALQDPNVASSASESQGHGKCVHLTTANVIIDT